MEWTNLVLFVEEDHHVGHTDLLGQQNVLLGLGHWAVGARHHKDSAVHLGSTSDHVLHVIRVARAIDVGVVPVLRLVLHGGRVDGDTTSTLLGGIVNLVVLLGGAASHGGEGHGEGSGESGLAVVDVADGANVDMRLLPLELLTGRPHGEHPPPLPGRLHCPVHQNCPAAQRRKVGTAHHEGRPQRQLRIAIRLHPCSRCRPAQHGRLHGSSGQVGSERHRLASAPQTRRDESEEQTKGLLGKKECLPACLPPPLFLSLSSIAFASLCAEQMGVGKER